MAVKVSAILKELLASAGVDTSTDEFKELATLAMEIPDEAASAARTELMTIESAKHSSVLKKHFTAQALNTVDAELNDLISNYGFEDADVEKFNAEKSSYKRIGLMHKRVLELESAKAAKGGDLDDKAKAKLDAMKAEVDKLNAEVLAAKEATTAKVAAAQKEAADKVKNYAVNAELFGKDYANKELSKEVNSMVARTLVEAELKAAGATLVHAEDGSLKLVQAENPELDFMVENKKVDFGSFTDKVLTEKKMLTVNGSGSADNTQTTISTDNVSENVEAEDFYAQQIAAFDQ